MSNVFQSSVGTTPIERRSHPGGTEGAAVSLGEVAKKIREWRNNEHVQGWAGRVLIKAGKPSDITDQAQALLDALREQCMYVPDPVGTEMIKAPKHTLCLDNALCMPAGDCFPKGTLLLRNDLEFIPIESIKVGDRIWGRNTWTRVEAVAFKGTLFVDALRLTNESTIELTEGHKIYVELLTTRNVKPWDELPVDRIRVSEAKEGDVLLQPHLLPLGCVIPCADKRETSHSLRIKEIARKVRETPCYDIQTEDHYVYLPEHDVTVSNCDDLSVALGAACMSVGIPVKVVGQAFNGGSVPSHVLIAIETKWGWKKVDPSHKTYDVGDSFPASREWWIDPLDEKTLALSGSTLGDFVGVGQPPSYVFPVGVGELTSADKSAIYNTVTAQLQTALFTLEKSVNDLGASLQQVEYTRSILTPGRPYDSEPFSITSLADFPSNGIWTANMATVATQIWTVGDKLVRAGHEALNGVRKIFVDESTHEAYIAAAPSDEWSVHTILDSATQRIYGFFDAAKNLMSGISAKDGRTLTPDQVQKTISAPGASGTVQGTPLVGTGIAPAVIVIGAVVGVAIAGIAIYYSVSKWCDTSKDAAREATNKAIIDCVTSGQCSAQQGQSMLDAVSNNRRLESEADAQNRAADPFASTLASVGKIVMWTVIGGATIYGITLVAPLVRNAVIRHRVRRLTA
jgi:hypothetical protein